MIPRNTMKMLFAFVCLLLPCSAFADEALSGALTQQLELNRQRYGIAGQALLVAHDGQVLFRSVDGEADVDTHQRLTADHVFPAYSLSKLLVSALVMQLVEQGLLDLDKSVGAYLPDLPAPWRAIAVRDLLDHTSGLPEYFGNQQGQGPSPDLVFPDKLQTAFASMAGTPMQFAPGSSIRYTQTNYLVLAALLAAHHGKPYPQVAEERIIRRLDLRHTWLGPAALSQHGVVTSYIGKNGRLEKDKDIAWPTYALGHAGLYTTLDDLARFLRAMTAGELVSKATLRKLWQQRTLAGGRRGWWATGWEYGESGGYRQVGHDGGTRVRARILFKDSLDGDLYTVIYLTNGSAKNVWSRVLVDSVMATVAPDRFPTEALMETLVSYALQAPAEGDANTKATAIRASAKALGNAELERTVNNAGYAIRDNLGLDAALRVFALNTVLFPDSANTWDSLAEAHAAKGDAEKAKALYDKAHALATRPAAKAGGAER